MGSSSYFPGVREAGMFIAHERALSHPPAQPWILTEQFMSAMQNKGEDGGHKERVIG